MVGFQSLCKTRQLTVLPTGRYFEKKKQHKIPCGKICCRIFGRFYKKGKKEAELFFKV
jgi:hypothetical protein